MNSVSDELLELEEKLTRYWLNTPLTLQKRIEMERHLRDVLDRRFGGFGIPRRIETNS